MPCVVGGSQKKSRKMRSSRKAKNSRRNFKNLKHGGSGLEAAIVPFGLLAVQQWFGTRNVQNKTKKNRK